MEGKIRCPCVNCDNFYHQSRKTIFFHLLHDRILRNYNPWEFHEEKSAVEEHINEGDEDKSDAEECVDPEESREAVVETFSMLHDMTITRAFFL